MKITLFQDLGTSLDLKCIAEHVSRLAPSVEVSVSNRKFEIPGFFVISPSSYKDLPAEVKHSARTNDLVLVFTDKQYDNNYFFEGVGNRIIVSFAGWERLTKIPKNNGAVFFLLAIVIRQYREGTSHRENSGCINDFWSDKTGVDLGMRTAFICPKCQGAMKVKKSILQEIGLVLNDLSKTSREETDICKFWGRTPSVPSAFDVFICHNSEDKPEVRRICTQLSDHGINLWLDEEQLPPGRSWQELLEEQILTIKTAAVFVGKNGIGPWQNQEMRCFLQEFVSRKCPVIPVVLGSSPKVPALPIFLRQMQWVDFRRTDPAPLPHLIWGITGIRPNRLRAKTMFA